MLKLAVFFAVVGVALGDVFFHVPRGSNGRQRNQNQDNVPGQNTMRLFRSMHANFQDSQGGYNAPVTDQLMYYFSGSELTIEMTVNLGLGSDTPGGGPNSAHTDLILQYTCSPNVRDGTEDQRPTNEEQTMEREGLSYMYGQHENWVYFDMCTRRNRNLGLFTADREFGGNARSARYTRSNPGGRLYGLECNEERDYYPYWSPTPWRDIAIITSQPEKCEYYQENSQNVKADIGWCSDQPQHLTKSECGKGWVTVKPWSKQSTDIAAPECLPAPWIGENMHSGKIDGFPVQYKWKVPKEDYATCALRVRYNVSIGDDWYTGHTIDKLGWQATNSVSNGADSPLEVNPDRMYVSCCDKAGRNDGLCDCALGLHPAYLPFAVYQDRTHTFKIVQRPEQVQNKIHNLNVRGKRGNVVQTYPATEYQFVPEVLECKAGEWIHMQWTGTDRNRQRNGNNGEGLERSDRSNIIQIETAKHNFPIDWELQSMFSSRDALKMAYMGLTRKEHICKELKDFQGLNDNERNQLVGNCAKLNALNPYFDGGLMPCLKPGVYHYMSSRNNNFSNRAQKGMIVVTPCPAGDADCSNADKLPVNRDGQFVAYEITGAAMSLLPSLALLLGAALFLFF